MTETMRSDLQEIADYSNDVKWLCNQSILITGAIGFIGSSLIRALEFLNANFNLELRIIGIVRDIDKAKKMFPKSEIEWIEHDFKNHNAPYIPQSIDYIVHTAAPTASRFMKEYPVETALSIVNGTDSILRLAKDKKVKKVVYISSIEVYGQSLNDTHIREEFSGPVNPLLPRSSYPVAKRMAETLSCAYVSEYNLPVVIARLTQTVGAGTSVEDQRVFMDFARCSARGEDLILHTNGNSAKPYLYITDAISAIITLLNKGAAGEAYNIANPDSYISVKDLALCMSEKESSKVVFQIDDEKVYPPETQLRLVTEKIQHLGWHYRVTLHDMISRQIQYYKELLL